jgi:hypothetical protein
MYSVSDGYKNAMKRHIHHFRIEGKIGDFPFTDKNILDGSFKITNQCSDSDDLTLGAVYIGELDATFRNIDVPRGTLKGKQITPTCYRIYKNSEGTTVEEGVPLGVFTITEASWSKSGVTIKAYDNMNKLDIQYGYNVTNGDLYGFLTSICSSSGVSLGMTQKQVYELPNASRTYALYPNNDIQTYRDLLSYVSAVAGGYATCDRNGAIVVRAYNSDVVDILQAENRLDGGEYSDYETDYSGIYLTNKSKNSTQYFGEERDGGTTLSLGENPLLQYGLDETKQSICLEILQKSLDFAKYTPFKIATFCDPCYDLGDVIVMQGGIAGASIKGCIMKFDWTYHDKFTYEGYGKDPSLTTAKSKEEKQIIGLANSQKGNKMKTYVYTNSGKYEIGPLQDFPIVEFYYATNKSGVALWHCEVHLWLVILDETKPATLNIKYVAPGIPATWVPKEKIIASGDHILNLFYPLKLKENEQRLFEVDLRLENASCIIDVGGVSGALIGQNLIGEDDWNGVIGIKDTIKPISLDSPDLKIADFSSNVDVELLENFENSIVENIPSIPIGYTLEISPVDIDFYLNKPPLFKLTWGKVKEQAWSDLKEEGY